MLFSKSVQGETASAFRTMFDLWHDSEWVEEQQFPPLHKIILGLRCTNVMRDVESRLSVSTAEINSPDAKGRTALAWAAARGEDDIVQLLLHYGANPNLACVTGNTPLLRAARSGSPKCVCYLIEAGAIVDWQSVQGFTALHYATYYTNDRGLVETLVLAGADIEVKDSYGWTPLACTAESDAVSCATVLLAHGANTESKDVQGWTPMKRAARRNSRQVRKLLLRCRANKSESHCL